MSDASSVSSRLGLRPCVLAKLRSQFCSGCDPGAALSASHRQRHEFSPRARALISRRRGDTWSAGGACAVRAPGIGSATRDPAKGGRPGVWPPSCASTSGAAASARAASTKPAPRRVRATGAEGARSAKRTRRAGAACLRAAARREGAEVTERCRCSCGRAVGGRGTRGSGNGCAAAATPKSSVAHVGALPPAPTMPRRGRRYAGSSIGSRSAQRGTSSGSRQKIAVQYLVGR